MKNVPVRVTSHTLLALEAVEIKGKLPKGALLQLTGPAIPIGKPSKNGKLYNPKSVSDCIAELQPRIAVKALFGELDHPPTDDIERLVTVKLSNTSHRIDRIWFNKDTSCWHIDVTILDNPEGRRLANMYEIGSPLFVSLRSLLDPDLTRTRPDGIIDAYMMALITIDFVSNPGFSDAEMTATTHATENFKLACESLGINDYINTKSMKSKPGKSNVKVIARYRVAKEGYTDIDNLQDYAKQCINALKQLTGGGYTFSTSKLPFEIDGMTVTIDGTNTLQFVGPNDNQAKMEVIVVNGIVTVPVDAEVIYKASPMDAAAWPDNPDATQVDAQPSATEMYKIVSDKKTSKPSVEMYKIVLTNKKLPNVSKQSVEMYKIVGTKKASKPAVEMYKIVGSKPAKPAVEMYKIVGSKPAKLTKPAVEMYKIVGSKSAKPAVEMYKIVGGKKASKPAIEMYKIVTGNATARVSIESITEQYNQIAKLPNSKYAGNYAIEHMPACYKHVWQGLSEPAKQIIADRGAKVATEADNLRLWSNIDFVSLERAVLLSDKKLKDSIASVESEAIKARQITENQVRINFLGRK